jgi:FixJ family two-component response regulator
MNGNTIVYVLDDDSRVRKSLEMLLSSAGYSVKQFASPDAFLAFPKPNLPSCLVLDLNLGETTGLELQQRIPGEAALPVIFLSGFGDISTTVKAMRGGAIEFLSKPIDESLLFPAIDSALRVAEERWNEREAQSSLWRKYETLTRREQQVLPYVVSGFLNKQTAYELGTSEITIRIHRGQIMRKMGADSLAHLVRIAVKLGIPESSWNTAQRHGLSASSGQNWHSEAWAS